MTSVLHKLDLPQLRALAAAACVFWQDTAGMGRMMAPRHAPLNAYLMERARGKLGDAKTAEIALDMLSAPEALILDDMAKRIVAFLVALGPIYSGVLAGIEILVASLPRLCDERCGRPAVGSYPVDDEGTRCKACRECWAKVVAVGEQLGVAPPPFHEFAALAGGQ